MTKKIDLDAADSALRTEGVAPRLLEEGLNCLKVVKVTADAVKSGAFQGKPALNVELESSHGIKVWKLIPMWPAKAGASTSETGWIRMARIALVDALGITSNELAANPEAILGRLVDAKIGIQTKEGYPDQNFVVTFVKDAQY